MRLPQRQRGRREQGSQTPRPVPVSTRGSLLSRPQGGMSYLIREQGMLIGDLVPALAGLEITLTSTDAHYPVTAVSGWIADQHTLFEVLDALCQSGLALLSVETVHEMAIDAQRHDPQA